LPDPYTDQDEDTYPYDYSNTDVDRDPDTYDHGDPGRGLVLPGRGA
jgi:hypothetical protein